MQDYNDFDKNLVALMEKMSDKKNLMSIYGFIENNYMFELNIKNLESR